MDISNHHCEGRFFLPWGLDNQSAAYLDNQDRIVELQNSEEVWRLFDLGNGSALGYDISWKCYLPEFVAAGWRKSAYPYQMSVWDLRTGKQTLSLDGTHFGEVKGAELINSHHLLTWGRDYQARLWDYRNGRLLDVFPLPLASDENSFALISCDHFGLLSNTQRASFAYERNRPSPNVQIYAMVAPGQPQLDYGRFPGNYLGDKSILQQHVQNSDLSPVNWIVDMQGAEAGYSTVSSMRDGRMVIGGSTYGADGYVYVWDGLCDLTILLPGRASINFEIAGEVEANRIEMRELGESGPPYRWHV